MPDVVLVHDYLNQFGGAERVMLQMAAVWPQAPIYTSLYRPESTYPEYRELDVRTTFLDRVPIDAGFRALAPVYPLAFRSLGALDADVVVSSSSGWAHGVRTTERATHVVYCYAPARWLYASGYVESRARRTALAPLLAGLRRWDRTAARRADGYIAIARHMQARIRSAYGIDCDVVYPPVDVRRFTPRPPGERLLVVSRLLGYKRVDLAVQAATRLGMGLDVVGVGPLLDDLRAVAGPTVSFHGALHDHALVELLEQCRATVLPGSEDFGLVPLEGNAAGKPAVALGAGGARETVVDGVTGVLVPAPTVEAFEDAIRRLDEIPTSPDALAEHARGFSPDVFRRELLAAVERVVQRRG